MRIGIEAVGNHYGGGFTVLFRTLDAICADRRVDSVVLYCSPPETFGVPLPDSGKIEVRPRPAEHDSLSVRTRWYLDGFDEAARADRVDAALCLNGVGRSCIGRVALVQQALTLVRARDVGVGPLRAARMRAFAALIGASLPGATAITQTGWMRAAVMARFGIIDVAVVPLGLPAGAPDASAPRHGIACITGTLGYKNFECAVAAAEILRSEFSGLRLRATLSADELRDEPAVQPLGWCTPTQVERLLQTARALVVPSRVESLGLPIVEAFAHGCPVVAADRPYAHDVADNAALFFDPEDPEDAAQALAEVLRDPDVADDLARRGHARLDRLWEPDPYVRLVDLLEEAA